MNPAFLPVFFHFSLGVIQYCVADDSDDSDGDVTLVFTECGRSTADKSCTSVRKLDT